LKQCLAVAAFTIAGYGWRRILMDITLFELTHQLLGNLLFGFGDGPSNA
jgi:hypothetical protein